MSIRDKFTDEEWTSVVQSPMLAGLAVTAADPSGLWSTIKESSGIARTLFEAKSGRDSDSLPVIISATFEQAEGRRLAQDEIKALFKGRKPAEISTIAVTRLGEIRALVESKAPEQANSFKEFVRATAQRVAEAGTEGGFLGFGGVTVSDAEKKTLDDIDRVLA